MTAIQLAPSFKSAPIRKVETLAELAGLSADGLLSLTQASPRMFREVRQLKKDGTPRICYDAHRPLKALHGRIKERILDRVVYPPYLQGGIYDPTGPRDYKSNAAIHAGARMVFTSDVENFFPSIRAEHVRLVWEKLFRFSPEVAAILTTLTTLDGKLPQGARTSTHLANLVLFTHEPALFKKLGSTGIRYSRFVDDLVWSSKRDLTKPEITEAIRLTYGMLKPYGFKPKRVKEHLYPAGCRMEVNNLVTNSRPALPKEERAAIRAAVHQLCTALMQGDAADDPLHGYASLQGRVQMLRRFHPDAGNKLLAQLKAAVLSFEGRAAQFPPPAFCVDIFTGFETPYRTP